MNKPQFFAWTILLLFFLLFGLNYIAGRIWRVSAINRTILDACTEHPNTKMLTPTGQFGILGGVVDVQCEMKDGTIYTLTHEKLFYLLPECKRVTQTFTLLPKATRAHKGG
jgi:hypothetical protein